MPTIDATRLALTLTLVLAAAGLITVLGILIQFAIIRTAVLSALRQHAHENRAHPPGTGTPPLTQQQTVTTPGQDHEQQQQPPRRLQIGDTLQTRRDHRRTSRRANRSA
ncbi:hypothetical protein [Leifsonia xyli]|uniref:hypothetical protein n=1 Tax=Leifsonia xyli TaxID=1575 RepID=UPI0003FAC23C|nr:hypothetical protein [Leifsonia xyli]